MTAPAPRDWTHLKKTPHTDRLGALREHQVQAWLKGDAILVEEYLRAFPDLDDDDKLVLIVGEMMLRQEVDSQLTLKDYDSRFPALAGELKLQYELLAGDSETPAADATLGRLAVGTPTPEIQGYALLERIGQGGMGIVHKARHIALNRIVAVKVLPGVYGPRELHRFLAEAEAIAAIDHPHVVKVFDSGQAGGTPYLAMEYVAGGTLADRLKTGPLPVSEAVVLVEKLARAVQALHELGVIHRDLKPSNILFDAAGEPRVSDFGLAKRAGANVTMTNAIVGTPAYMAPEQAKGESRYVGPAADVWALGVMLFECLTGARPFAGATHFDVIQNVIEAEPATLRSHNRTLPRELEAVVQACLAKTPADRYPSVLAIAEDLARFGRGERLSVGDPGVLRRGVKWVRRNRIAASILAAAVLGVAVASSLAAWAVVERGRADTKANEAVKAEQAAQGEVVRTTRLLNVLRMNQAESYYERNAVQTARDTLQAIPGELRSFGWHLHARHVDGADWTLYPPAATIAVAWHPQTARVALACQDGVIRIWEPALGNGFREWKGHARTVSCVAWSPDGTLLATAAEDGTLRVWNADGKAVAELKGFAKVVESVAWSPDGQSIAGASGREVRIWNASTGEAKRDWVAHLDSVHTVAWNPDGRTIATGGGDPSNRDRSTVKLWNAATGARIREMNDHSLRVNTVAWSPDGKRLASGSHDKTIRLWDPATGNTLHTLSGHMHWVAHLAWNPDGRSLASACVDRTVRVWDTASGYPLQELKGHSNAVECVAWSSDGRTLASAAADQTVRFWEPARGNLAEVFIGHKGAVTGVAWSPDGTHLAASCLDTAVHFWNVADGKRQHELPLKANVLLGVAWSPDGATVAACSLKGKVILIDPATAAIRREIAAHDESVQAAAWSPDSKVLATAGQDRIVRLWDAATGTKLRELAGHTHHVMSLAWSPDGRTLASGSADKTLRLWVAESGALLKECLGHTHAVAAVHWHPDGTRLVTGGSDQTLRIWNAATGESLSELRGHTDGISGVAWSRDGTVIASGSRDRTLRLWDPVSGQVLKELKGHTDGVEAIAWSPDGRTLASSAADRTVRLWSIAPQPAPAELRGHLLWVTAAALNTDGKLLASTGTEGTVLVWDLATGKPLQSLSANMTPLDCLAWSPDGSIVVTGGRDGVVRLWNAVSGKPGHILMGHRQPIESVGFARDGARIVSRGRTEMKVWDAATGVIRDEPAPETVPSLNESAGVRYQPGGHVIVKAALGVEADETARRLRLLAPQPDFHREQGRLCEETRQWFAMAFHWRLVLRESPADANATMRLKMAENLLSRPPGR